jgi:hypothetical protein
LRAHFDTDARTNAAHDNHMMKAMKTPKTKNLWMRAEKQMWKVTRATFAWRIDDQVPAAFG